MSMVIQGIELSQEQLDAIVPVINKYAKKPSNNPAKMEVDCLAAMEKANCPLQSETSPSFEGKI